MSSTDEQLHKLLEDLSFLQQFSNQFVLSRHGLRRVRYHTMHHLYLQPELTLGQLNELTFVAPASSSRMVYQMEKEGLVQRTPSETDRRLFTLSLTDEGLALYKKVKEDMDLDIQKRFETLDESTKSSMLELNRHLRDALSYHRAWQEEAG